MKITTIKLYEVNELSKEAFQEAYTKWRDNIDNPFLQSMLNDECGQLLAEHKIECTSNHPVCLYSLSHCQGDGLMFEGTFEWKGDTFAVKHSGYYYHSYSAKIIAPEASEIRYTQFETIYREICKKLEKMGYQMIEDEESEAHFIDECNANEYTFEENGRMRNV